MKNLHQKIRSGLKAGVTGLLRHAGIQRRVRRLLGRSAPAVENYVGSKLLDRVVLSSVADVDRFLTGMRSDFTERELRAYWDRHQVDRHAMFGRPVTADPHSDAYREQVVADYRILSGRVLNSYENERTPSIDPRIHLARPFPYDMKRASVSVSNMLYTFARVFSLVEVEEGQRLIEFGSGWGNAVFQFAQAGVSVTLVDIEENFLELARQRFDRLGMPLECRHGEFNDIDLPAGSYDYALFMSAFHHCIDHVELLKKIHRSLADQGQIIFCGEPIHEEFEVPWGLRMDGESLWAIRSNGWLELGFQESYFRACLLAAGFLVRKHVFSAEKGEIVWIARKIRPGNWFFDHAANATNDAVTTEQYYLPEDSPQGRIVFTKNRNCVLPLPDPAGAASVELSLINYLPVTIRVRIVAPGFDRVLNFASGQNESLAITVASAGQSLQLETELFTPANDRRALGIAIREIQATKGNPD